jgi:hypothetical protein
MSEQDFDRKTHFILLFNVVIAENKKADKLNRKKRYNY